MKAVNLYPAQILGAAKQLGALEVGKLASFFVSSGNPFDIRSQVLCIFIQGRELAFFERQTWLRDNYQQRAAK